MRGALSEMIEETMSDSCCDTADRKYQIRTEKPNSDTADNTFSSSNIHLKNYTVTEDNVRSEQKHPLLAIHFRKIRQERKDFSISRYLFRTKNDQNHISSLKKEKADPQMANISSEKNIR